MKNPMKFTIAGIAASIMAGLFLSAPLASADNSTVDQWQDPGSRISAQGTVRHADMAVRKTESPMFEPQGAQELNAIEKSWRKSFCAKGETSKRPGVGDGSERCRDRGR
jgi:hypothetical protein